MKSNTSLLPGDVIYSIANNRYCIYIQEDFDTPGSVMCALPSSSMDWMVDPLSIAGMYHRVINVIKDDIKYYEVDPGASSDRSDESMQIQWLNPKNGESGKISVKKSYYVVAQIMNNRQFKNEPVDKVAEGTISSIDIPKIGYVDIEIPLTVSIMPIGENMYAARNDKINVMAYGSSIDETVQKYSKALGRKVHYLMTSNNNTKLIAAERHQMENIIGKLNLPNGSENEGGTFIDMDRDFDPSSIFDKVEESIASKVINKMGNKNSTDQSSIYKMAAVGVVAFLLGIIFERSSR
jgi:hypothetical protein